MARGVEECLSVIKDSSTRIPLSKQGIDFYLSKFNVTRRFEIRDKAKKFLLEIQESVFKEKENKAGAEEREKSLAQLNETIATIEERMARRSEDREEDAELIARLERELMELDEENPDATLAELNSQAEKLDREVEDLQQEFYKKEDEYKNLGFFEFSARKKIRLEMDKIIASFKEKESAARILRERIRDKQLEEEAEESRQRMSQRKHEEEEMRAAEEERIREVEEDKKVNPFKYFVIDRMSDEVFEIIFGETKKDISLEQLNKFGESGREFDVWTFESFSSQQSYIVNFTSNGVLMQLQNPEEVRKEDAEGSVLFIRDPKAKYAVISPDWYYKRDGLSYNEAYELMTTVAQEYQDRLLAEFEAQNKQ